MPGKVPSPRQRFVKVPARKVGQVPQFDHVVDEKIANRVLPDGKRKVLEDLLGKEQERAKRSKLATILVQKLSVKYGRFVCGLASLFIVRSALARLSSQAQPPSPSLSFSQTAITRQ